MPTNEVVHPRPDLSSVMDSFREPMILLDANYRIHVANRAYRRAHGLGEEVLDAHCYEVSHGYSVPCDQAGETCPLRASRASREPRRVLHLHHTPHGEEYVDVEVFPVRDGNGRITHFLEVLHQVSAGPGEAAGQKMLGRSPGFTHMLELIRRVAPSDSAVLLLGESGTGKELAARAVHDGSQRASGPFVPVECSGLTETLFESELFGHERGAFTGAYTRKIGLVEAAHGGTLFLDEVGDIPLDLQVKLLRLLETGTYRTVGGVEPKRADFRLICATHRSLRDMVEEGRFRRDLFYRLGVFPIHLPALRERREDLPLLIDALLERVAPGRRLSVSPQALECLEHYSFPGNIRELRNLLERASLLADGDWLLPEHFPDVCDEGAEPSSALPRFTGLVPLEQMERGYLLWAVNHFGGNKRELAKRLGLSERTLYRKLARLAGPDEFGDS